MWPEGMDMSMFDPWELINTMDQLKIDDPALANQIGMGLDKMGYTRDVVTNAMSNGSPLPPPMRLGMQGVNDQGLPDQYPAPPQASAPVPQAGVPPPRPAPGGMGEAMPPDMTSAAPSFTPPVSLGGLTMPSGPPPELARGAAAPIATGAVNGPPVPGVDPRTQAMRAMAANQGFKAPQEPKAQVQDIRQAPPPPKVGETKHGASAIQMLLAAALSGGGGPKNPLRVPALGALVRGQA